MSAFQKIYGKMLDNSEALQLTSKLYRLGVLYAPGRVDVFQ